MNIRVKIDEDLPREIAQRLRLAGHDALDVVDQALMGSADTELWKIIQQEERCLVTADKGFANAKIYPPGTHGGIILLRLPRESRSGYIRLVEKMLTSDVLATVLGGIVVVSPDTIRIHRKS